MEESSLPVVHRAETAESGRFEARIDDAAGAGTALALYRRQGHVLVLHQTEVPPALQGRGVAAALVAQVLDWARAEGLRVRPSCSYVAAYMRRHPRHTGPARMNAPPPVTPESVLAFWFGDPPATASRPEWFRKDPAFDAEVRVRFGAALEAALAGGLGEWDATPRGALARIVVLDQFTRNAFRDTPRAFAGDAAALAAAQALVAAGTDRALGPHERWFAYLPFEHAEDLGEQQRAIALFGALADEHPALADTVVWARRHAEVIERFGRFPHRNTILGRRSTPEELEYLRQPGAGF